MNYQVEIQEKFENLLSTKFSQLQPVNKWNQTMWQLNGKVVVSLVHLSNKSKFCFFNNPQSELDKLQRWGNTIYSNNLEIEPNKNLDWNNISSYIYIVDTINNHDSL